MLPTYSGEMEGCTEGTKNIGTGTVGNAKGLWGTAPLARILGSFVGKAPLLCTF